MTEKKPRAKQIGEVAGIVICCWVVVAGLYLATKWVLSL
jgi:hypothetical protein